MTPHATPALVALDDNMQGGLCTAQGCSLAEVESPAPAVSSAMDSAPSTQHQLPEGVVGALRLAGTTTAEGTTPCAS